MRLISLAARWFTAGVARNHGTDIAHLLVYHTHHLIGHHHLSHGAVTNVLNVALHGMSVWSKIKSD